MSESALQPYEALTEEQMKAALIEARGDIFIASQLMKITAIRLDRAIRKSDVLQAVVEGIRDAKQTGRYQQSSLQDFQQAVERRILVYRAVGLDALHELATMPLDPNSAQNQVKLAAAARLAGPSEGSSGTGELVEALRELNKEYHANAPRFRVIRQTTTVLEASPAPAEQRGTTLEHDQPSE